ncbi:MAG TPA: pyridoxal 5'-phosphate synthase, partial [Methylocystis sp.]|nr:pyridoxal 5'-phosphate synthase [Methylocystis sp.]
MSALTAGDLDATTDPISLFSDWFEEAKLKEINDANAMALATSGQDGLPDVRMVLMKDWDENGFVFYTNAESAKGTQLAANMQAAGLFYWKSLRRQVRLRGPVTPAPDTEADAYYASRPRESRIGAWASRQSRELESRFALEKAVA